MLRRAATGRFPPVGGDRRDLIVTFLVNLSLWLWRVYASHVAANVAAGAGGVMEADGFAAGDAGFAEFYAGSYARIVTLVAVLLGDPHEAQDVAQEAFARALGRWPRLRRYDVPEAWVRKVAFRLAVDASRRTRRQRLLPARLASAGSGEVPDAAPPGDGLEFSGVAEALAGLPMAQREVIVLHYLADLPVEQIARDRGLPSGTVKSRLVAGRRRLEAALKDRKDRIEVTGHV
jgi:RNA polymerase sigma-70 factor (ECF subfamily)